MEYKKINYNDYTVHLLKTDKFKSIYISLTLMNEYKKESLTRNFILRKLLTTSSKKLSNESEVTKKVCDLYNSGIVISNTICNNVITTNFDMEVLDDKYTENGLLNKALEYYFDTIFYPNIVNDEFEENNYNLVLKSVNNYYDTIKENKNRYAYERAFSLLDEEYLRNSENGSREDLEGITRKNMVTYYNELLLNANANIFVIGSFEEKELLDIINNNVNGKLHKNNNMYIDGTFYKNNKLKEKEEREDNNQSILIMIYKIINMTLRERNVILPVFNRIFGIGNNSKLFKNIREENSLCYDIRSNCLKNESILTVQSGISYNNKNKVIEFVKKQLNDIQNGLISDSEFDEAIKFRDKTLKQFEDYNDSILYIKQGEILYNSDDLEQRKNNLKTVKKEEIIELSKKLDLSVIYMLKGDNEDGEN